MSKFQNFLLDGVDLALLQPDWGQHRVALFFSDTYDDVAATEVVEIVRECADRVQHGERIPTCLEFESFPFHSFAMEQRLNVDRQGHELLGQKNACAEKIHRQHGVHHLETLAIHQCTETLVGTSALWPLRPARPGRCA